jgi:hypothetical protein
LIEILIFTLLLEGLECRGAVQIFECFHAGLDIEICMSEPASDERFNLSITNNSQEAISTDELKLSLKSVAI